LLLGLICGALGHANRQLRDRLDRTAYRYAGISLAIVMLIAHSESVWVVAVHRFIEVSIGIVVALAVTVLWPEPQLPVALLPQAI
jgi:uncharacterized membrane protein YccC